MASWSALRAVMHLLHGAVGAACTCTAPTATAAQLGQHGAAGAEPHGQRRLLLRLLLLLGQQRPQLLLQLQLQGRGVERSGVKA